MLVEGQMDVIHSHQAGFENAVALSGTALTARHLGVMKRYSDNLMLVLDADQAGLSATAKSALLALGEGLKVKAARLSAGKDPADLITEDPKAFTTCIKEAKPVVDFFLVVLAERERDSHRLIALVERVVLPLIRAVKSSMEREHFVQATARALGLSSEAVRESLGRMPATEPASRAVAGPVAERGSARKVREEILVAAVHAYPVSLLAKRIETEYNRITGTHPPPSDTLSESLIFQAERTFGAEPSEGAADELLHAFEEAVIREAYQQAVQDLRRAETAGDAARIQSAQEACTALSGQLARLG
jgi:DNA primase